MIPKFKVFLKGTKQIADVEKFGNDSINPSHYVFGWIETIEYLKKDKWYLDKLIDFENDRKLSTIEDLQATYAPKIKMTKKESEMLKSLKRTPQISVGIVDYSGREPKVLLSNEFKFVDAWLHPELIEVSED